MVNRTKIVFLGASSMSFGLSMLRDIFSSDELRGSTLTLVGRNPKTLAKMAGLARLVNNKTGAGLQSSSRPIAGPLSTAPIRRQCHCDRSKPVWKLDFEVPRNHGIRHTLGENGGPGGLFFTFAPCRWCSISCARCRSSVQRRCSSIFQSGKPHHPGAWKIQPDRGAWALPRHFHGTRRRRAHHRPAPRAGRRLGCGHQSFPMPDANSQSRNWRRPLSSAATKEPGLRPFVRAADPPAFSGVRILDDLQR